MKQWIMGVNLYSKYLDCVTERNSEIAKWTTSSLEYLVSFHERNGYMVHIVTSMYDIIPELARKDRLYVLIAIYIHDMTDDQQIECKIAALREITNIPIKLTFVDMKIKNDDLDRFYESGLDAFSFVRFKPFTDGYKSPLLQSQALIRRYTTYNKLDNCTQDFIFLSDLLILLDSRKVFSAGREISFTKTEFDVLVYLAKNIDIALSYQQIYERIWKEAYAPDVPNIVGCQVCNIRVKLKKYSSKVAERLKSIPGIGYRFDS